MGSKIFYFIYRKRFFNSSENSYLGYERKRGNLIQFNKILLHQYNKEDISKNYFASTFSNFNIDIKYVITLDTDTELVLNTALGLVGAMAHPLNKPILNKNNTKVIKGYGLMQPRVSVDIESTNKSLYSQIFASIGGFDSYTSIIPNVYQDLFNEGSFVGKGIYDLKVFDTVMTDACPDNLVLSHDLLEGNYIRCAFLADVELIDDFPVKFLSDATRQYRWARGDVQIIGWLKPYVKNKKLETVKNPLNGLGKWKILDNIMRMFLAPMVLLIAILGSICTNYAYQWGLFVLLGIALPILFYLKSKLYTKKGDAITVRYGDVLTGFKSLIINSYINLCTIPFYSKLYMDAFFRTIYRLTISHKNLLNWITAEDAEKTTKNDLKNYLKNFNFNLMLGIILVVFGLFKLNILSIIYGLIFISAPFVLHQVSQPLHNYAEDLDDKEKDNVLSIAKKTWSFFNDNLKQEYNYLMPDNYQENREIKTDYRTSGTDISYSLISIICADELGFINDDEAIDLLAKVITSVEKLPKWYGHLYNWYNIKTMDALNPLFVSTVDSGNFVASLIVTSQFLNKKGNLDLVSRVEYLINNTDFKRLYTDKDVFSIGYDLNEAKLSIYNYNKFASESRLTSYIAIAKGDVPSKHWFCLDKNLTTYNHAKGLISWSGTSFEYYMPYLYMKNYQHTLFDETYHFAFMCEKDYMNSINKDMPWGMSESAYDELDNAQNYKYKAFATPYLKAKEDKDPRIVISPYSSIMAMQMFPKEVYDNLNKFKKINMYGDYGFYESYDLDTNNQVKAYFSHHQGMSLAAMTNYLTDGSIQNYFHSNINIRTFEILLKEKIQVVANIDMKIAKYKRYDYTKESIENDIRAFNYISDLPEVSVLSNKKYCLLMNDRGDSFSRYRTIQLNRYRKVTEQDYGIFMYIKDLKTAKVWSNTYAPINKMPDKYDVIFASDMIKYIRSDDDIITTTEIIVTKDHHAELRKITFKNLSDEDKTLELTTYTEPIIAPNTDDVSHRVFNNMFLESCYDSDTDSLITMKKSKEREDANSYVINRLIIDKPLIPYQYETDRAFFIGRNHNASNPDAINKVLTNQVGTNLEPIMSLRNRILVGANDEVSVCLINGFGRSKEQLLDIVNTYDNKLSIKKAFEVANLMNVMNTRSMNITGSEMRVYNTMLNYLYQTTKIAVSGERKELLKKNALGQNGLWKFGISGDYPIVLANINDIGDISFIMDLLKCFEYYKNNSIFVDFVIINSENEQYAKVIKKEIDDEVYRMYTLNNFNHTPGIIKVISNKDITKEEMSLLNIVPRLKFDLTDHKSLKEKINDLQYQNRVSLYTPIKLEKNIPDTTDYQLDFKTDFGGFNKDGSEYIITNPNTPTPWSNIIANENFGTIVTNNGCGYTWAYNSNEYKLTSWTNDMVLNDKSEGFKINGEIFDPTTCRQGFGYSILSSETAILKKEVTEFVPVNDTIKIYILKLTNKENHKQNIDLGFYINPTFGNFEEKTARHILSEYMDADNYLKIRNVYSIHYSNIVAFMSSSLKINNAIDDKILVKEIDTKVTLSPNEEKTIIFTLGCSDSTDKNLVLMKKYNDIYNANKALEEVKDKWRKNLNIINVKTPSSSFNLMLNGWYLYQTISSRLLARAGFYQVSGAYGFRDQLQDAMNIVLVRPDLTRNQILINAMHQFKGGDVLHWWHEGSRFGLRSRYKDDYLWLIYATYEYIMTSCDYDILNEEVPFVVGDMLAIGENEKGLNFNYSSEKAPLFKHLELALNYSMNQLGSHGLPLMGGGDWNDGMNKVGIKGLGESVWLGFFLYMNIDCFIEMMQKYDKYYDLSKYEEFNKNLSQSLNDNAWDGDYYLRAYFDNGHKLGSHENTECKIDLIAQSFSIISGVVPKERINSVINSVESNLVDKELGIIKLLVPPFAQSIDNPGYIMNYPEGIRENGGQYTHAVSWYLMALIKEGYYDKAYEYFQMINPVNRSRDNEGVYRYKVEPYVIAADIYSSSRYPARGGWTWYTGSAGWFYKVGLNDIIGFNKTGNNLCINPHMPTKWDEYSITYNYMDTKYKIEVKAGKEDKLSVDGKKQKDINIKLVNDNRTHNVKVVIKR
jgi:cyclic beta-1,2-glucan synthetase